MIDKLELRVPHSAASGVPFSEELKKHFAEDQGNPRKLFQRAKFYSSTADLRRFGIPAIIHLESRNGNTPSSKIELIETAKYSLSEIVAIVQRVFLVNAAKLEIMRIDLTIDVPGISVQWFQEHMRVKFKQVLAQLGNSEILRMGRAAIETLYYGKRPNMLRAYDKMAERRETLARASRRCLPHEKKKTFEEMFGFADEGQIITRIERQIGNGHVPEEIETIEKCRMNISRFNPFEAVEFLSGASKEPNRNDYDFDTYCAGMYIRERALREGAHLTLKFLSKGSGGQLARTLKRFGDFLPSGNETILSAKDLQELFATSVQKQLET